MYPIDRIIAEYGNSLYHYTSISALYNILQSKKIWIGSTSSMNDSRELIEYTERFIKLLDYNTRRSGEEEFNRFLQIEDALDEYIAVDYHYALSLSPERDDAAQWERYADNAKGACICFDTRLLYELLVKRYGMDFDRVLYDQDIKNSSIFKSALDYIRRGSTKMNFNRLIDSIVCEAAFNKHISFRTERECRFTLHLSHSSDSSFELLGNRIKSVYSVNLDLDDKFASILKEILIGPKSPQTAKELEGFCSFLGYYELADSIHKSSCPLQ